MELSKLYLLILNSLSYKLRNQYPNLADIEMYYGIADTRTIVHIRKVKDMADLFKALSEIDTAIKTRESTEMIEILDRLPEGVNVKDKCLIAHLDRIEIVQGSIKYKEED